MTTNEEEKLLTESRASRDAEYIVLGESNPNASAASHDGADREDSESEDPGTPRQVGGAAAAGCLAGLVLFSPLVALLAAAGAAAVATSRGEPGKVARRCGDSVADAGDRLKRFGQKHRVVDRSTRWVSNTFHRDHASSAHRTSTVV
jgi:hypothetical protein